jgi:hypothetical protein
MTGSLNQPGAIIGIKPWLPWPLSRWKLWTAPVAAERLAALRIGLAAVLFFDVLLTYLPMATTFFGKGSLGSPSMFAHRFKSPSLLWSVFKPPSWMSSGLKEVVESSWFIQVGLIVWAIATFMLLIGLWTRPSAIVVWILSTSIASINSNIDNAGDLVRGILLFYLMLCPCGAAWSIDAWRKRRKGMLKGPALVYPWPIRLLFLQMTLIYFFNGVYKASGSDWIKGDSLYYVLCDLTLSRWSYGQWPIWPALLRVASWVVMSWEVSFPLLICWRPTRLLALWLGVAFHLGIGISMELGGFALYMLCFYLPLVPWEKWCRRYGNVVNLRDRNGI